MSVIYQPPPTTTTQRYFLWSFAGDYLGTCFGRSSQDAREKFAAVHDMSPRHIVARPTSTFRPFQL